MAKKIFVVDDDPAIVDAVRMILELEDYEVVMITDGKDVYTLSEHPDLFLLDIWMSGVDGRDICRYLKKNPLTKTIPVIMLSASKDIVKSAKESGADDFLAKPFEMNELLEKVAKHTNNT